MFGSKARELARLRADKADLAERLDAERTEREQRAGGAARAARRYNTLARVVATYIVTADEQDIDISPGDLRAAIERARINLAIEYARAGKGAAL